MVHLTHSFSYIGNTSCRQIDVTLNSHSELSNTSHGIVAYADCN